MLLLGWCIQYTFDITCDCISIIKEIQFIFYRMSFSQMSAKCNPTKIGGDSATAYMEKPPKDSQSQRTPTLVWSGLVFQREELPRSTYSEISWMLTFTKRTFLGFLFHGYQQSFLMGIDLCKTTIPSIQHPQLKPSCRRTSTGRVEGFCGISKV